jgi:putative SOS response-associated peptidase YedK
MPGEAAKYNVGSGGIRSSLTPVTADDTIMCGRFTLFASPVAVADLFGTAPPPDLPPRYNIAPTQTLLACRLDATAKARELVRLRWGLVPSWAKDLSAGVKPINARAKTLADSSGASVTFW